MANIGLNKNAENFSEQVKSISIALDNSQSGNGIIGAVHTTVYSRT